jgi:hypothetical protein
MSETATPQIRRQFRREARRVNAALRDGGLEEALEAVSVEEWTELLTRVWMANGEIYFDRTMEELGPFNPNRIPMTESVRTIEAIRRYAAENAERIVENTRRRIEATVERARNDSRLSS